jgi:8-oxo-dGTP pyrophosphatase MutT (NUDIX family)
MIIFLDDRIIKLSRKPSKCVSENERMYEYSSSIQVTRAFEEFEKKENLHSLVFWSDDNFKQLKHDFFSLFKYIKAAGGLVKNERNEFLVIFRYGKWDLPKGKINFYKTQSGIPSNKDKRTPELGADAAIREVMEETGLKQVSITGQLSSTYHIYYQKNTRYLKKTYWFSMSAESEQSLIPQSDEDISIVKWAAKDELQEIAEHSYSSLGKLFRSAQKQ